MTQKVAYIKKISYCPTKCSRPLQEVLPTEKYFPPIRSFEESGSYSPSAIQVEIARHLQCGDC